MEITRKDCNLVKDIFFLSIIEQVNNNLSPFSLIFVKMNTVQLEIAPKKRQIQRSNCEIWGDEEFLGEESPQRYSRIRYFRGRLRRDAFWARVSPDRTIKFQGSDGGIRIDPLRHELRLLATECEQEGTRWWHSDLYRTLTSLRNRGGASQESR